ncbi:hypothetical protein EHS25_004043 [Saitozyma podzolica]|uniref:Glucose-methanol-choline oxidoreductase N-terminal domain-containing protein n=1 Tax=Saitozyma podzolica TaxID=1890683 RepID=A0A427YSZ6_9TREE|nr:hypothetical protein EHS25_004043 [Saitozyma podzolica]
MLLTHSSLLVLLSVPLTLAAPAKGRPRTRNPLAKRTLYYTDGGQVSNKNYDYVIAGGGLTGVVLAKRLSEDASKTILLIEAGYDEENNPEVYDASQYQAAFDTSLDWAYQTVPQSNADGQSQTIRAGKALGGSTAINGMAWSKPNSFQVDAMETVGNPGLNWAALETYMLRAENFEAPSSAQAAAGITYRPSCHASNGPINIQFDPSVLPANLERNFNQTVLNLGLPYAYDLTCGDPSGAAPIANTRNGNTRIDAYRGYLYQQNIPNLTILNGAQVGKVILSSDSTPRATGVQYRDQNGNTYTTNANLEVIVATGAIKTPVILQQSGIGPASVLQSAGVTQRVDLPVGLNLIDQTTTTTDWSFRGNRGGGQVITFPRFQDMFSGNDATTMQNILQNDLGSYAQAAVDAGAFSTASGLQTILEIQRGWILNQGVGFSENFDYSFGNTLGYDSWYLLPFGRGSVKITGNDAYSSSGFSIDPRYFSTQFDSLAQGATARFTRTVSTTSPLSNDVTGESVPGGAVGNGASLQTWATWAENNYRSNWHPIGTAAMMSQDLGGCVNSNNSVYGTTGLRVVDASLLPFQMSSHLMSVLYGLSERAADIIKAAHSGPTPTSSSSSSSATSTSSSASSSSTAPPTVTGVAIHPQLDSTKCLEVRGSSYSNGVLVDIGNCNNAANQKWQMARGSTAVKLAGTNFCLDAGSNPANGVQMKIWQCYPGITAQTWYYTNDNYIAVQNQGQCLDLTNGNTNAGNIVQTWACSSNNNNQHWLLTSS